MVRRDNLSKKYLKILALFFLAAGTSSCSYYSKVVYRQDPLSSEEHMKLGMSYESQGLKELSAREYRSALQKDKKNAAALLALGNNAFESENWKDAEKYFKRALKANPRNPAAANNLAMVYIKQEKHLDRGIQIVQKALENPGKIEPYLLDTLANLYIAQGGWLNAHRALDQAARHTDLAENKPFQDHFLRSCDKLAALYNSARPDIR